MAHAGELRIARNGPERHRKTHGIHEIRVRAALIGLLGSLDDILPHNGAEFLRGKINLGTDEIVRRGCEPLARQGVQFLGTVLYFVKQHIYWFLTRSSVGTASSA